MPRLQMMPRDVTTRWNSTYDMLEFAVEYREALESITGNQKMKLRQYELTEDDWKIATQLRDILKVRYYSACYLILDQACSDRSSRTPPSSSRVVHPTLPPWYLPWTTSMSTSPMQLLIPSIPCRSRPPLLLGRKLSIDIMTKQTIRKSFASQWVYFLL